MKVNTSQSEPLWSDPNRTIGKTKSSEGKAVEKVASPSDVSSSMDSDAFSTSDAVKMQETVKELMQQSAVRSEVVEGYDISEPVKSFDEETLRRFISALSQEP